VANQSASYYRARYYDPGTGRFLNEVPVRFDGGKNHYLIYTFRIISPSARTHLGLASHYWGWRRIGGNSDVWKQQRPVEFRALYGRGADLFGKVDMSDSGGCHKFGAHWGSEGRY